MDSAALLRYVYLAILFVLALVVCQAAVVFCVYCKEEREKYQRLEQDDVDCDSISQNSDHSDLDTIDDDDSLTFCLELDYDNNDREVPSTPTLVARSDRREDIESLLRSLAAGD